MSFRQAVLAFAVLMAFPAVIPLAHWRADRQRSANAIHREAVKCLAVSDTLSLFVTAYQRRIVLLEDSIDTLFRLHNAQMGAAWRQWRAAR